MKWFAWLSGALVSLALFCPSALSQEADGGGKAKKARKGGDKKAREPKQQGPKGEYAIMAKMLEMDVDQQAKLTDAVEKANQARKDWDASPSGQKYKELSEARKQAAKDKDKEKSKSIGEQIKALQKEQSDMQAAQKAAIMAILNDDQKAKWNGFVLYRGMMGRYKKCNLAEDQDKQLRDLCQAAAKDMPDSSDRKANAAAMKKLGSDIEEKILTDAQRADLKKKPDKAPAEPKKAREKGAGKGKKANTPVNVE